MKSIVKWFLVFVILSTPVVAEEYRFVINTGHMSPPAFLHFDEDTQYLISISESGQMLLLTPDTHRVVKDLQLTDDKIIDLVFNNEYSELAIITYSDLTFSIEVWDWHRGVQLFKQDLSDKPLYMRYTLAGKHLVIGSSERPTTRFLDHSDGKAESWFEDSSHLFQDVYVGATEKTLMGYRFSGQLAYYDISSGERLIQFSTEPGLEWIEVIQRDDKVITLGKKGNVFYLINRQDGSVLDQLEIENLLTWHLNSNKGVITFIKEIRGNSFLFEYDLSILGFETIQSNILVSRDDHIKTIANLGDLSIIGNNDGQFYQFYPDSEEYLPFFDESQLKILDMQILDDSLYLSTQEKIIKLESPFFNEDSKWSDLKKVRQTNQIYPNRGSFEMDMFHDKILAFSSDAEIPAPLLQSNEEGLLERIPVTGDKLLSADHVNVLEDQVLTVSNGSDIAVYDLSTGDNVFSWSSQSIVNAVFFDNDSIVYGKASSPGHQGVIEILNIKTGEITPLSDPYFYLLDMYKTDEGIYFLGLKEQNDAIVTELNYIDFDDPYNFQRKFYLAKEDYSSKIFIDENHRVFVTLSGMGFVYIDGRRTRTVETKRDIEEMLFHDNKCIMRYDNQSIGFWDMDRNSEELILNFFSDYSWLAIASDNKSYFYTPEAKDNFFVYRLVRR